MSNSEKQANAQPKDSAQARAVPTLENFQTFPLSDSLKENIGNIKKLMQNSSDLLVNPIRSAGVDIILLCCEGLISTNTMTELILHPLMYLAPEQVGHAESSPGANQKKSSQPTGKDLLEHIDQYMLLSIDRSKAATYGDLLRFFMSGFAVILAEGANYALVMGVQGYDKRGVDEPAGEQNIKGGREGFVEIIRTNMGMIRRRMKTPALTFELFQLGEKSQTDLCLAYMQDKAPPSLLAEIKRRLKHVRLDTILSGGYIQPWLEGRPLSLFQNIGTTERPDVLCAHLLEGRVALLVDGTPHALVIPTLFVEHFQTLDDYNCKPYYAVLIRWVKYLAFLVTILLPGGYVAVALFHPALLNDTLLMNLATAEQSAPFPLMLETLLVLIFYEILREAGIRLPKAVGGAVSLVGGLIIGDAAVQSGLVSTPLLIMVALAVTASFVIPGLEQSTTILRFSFVLAGGLAGLFGIAVLFGVMLFNLCAMEDFGIPVTAPLSPFTSKAMRDVATRVDMPKMEQGGHTIEELNGVKIQAGTAGRKEGSAK